MPETRPLLTALSSFERLQIARGPSHQVGGAREGAQRTADCEHDQMPALTGIRFVLALWVIVHHLSGPGRMLHPLASASPVVGALIGAAFAALTVFFAISGFVLARRYRSTRWTRPRLLRYAAARFGRIYPLYLLSLVILAPIILEAARSGELGGPWNCLSLLANHALLLQGWVKPAVNWNTPAWSLSCEVFFYACAPLVVRGVRHPSWPRIVGVALVAFAVPVALRLTVAPPIPKVLLYFGDFVAGVAAAGAYERLGGQSGRLSYVGPWLSAAGLIGGMGLLLWRAASGWSLLFDAGVRLASLLLVLGLASSAGWLARMLSSRRALVLGGASYAIYILHVPLLWWFERSTLHRWLPPAAAGVVYVVEVLTLSLVVWRWYERPANEIVRSVAERHIAAHVPGPRALESAAGSRAARQAPATGRSPACPASP
ncbi:MAG: acyltransferase family protein [Vicinamibacterales bacterium]